MNDSNIRHTECFLWRYVISYDNFTYLCSTMFLLKLCYVMSLCFAGRDVRVTEMWEAKHVDLLMRLDTVHREDCLSNVRVATIGLVMGKGVLPWGVGGMGNEG